MKEKDDGKEHSYVHCVGNGQLHQVQISEKVGALNCMHDQQVLMIEKGTNVDCNELISGVRNDGVSQTLDANYFKGAGERNGEEREVLAVAIDCRNNAESEVNGTLQADAKSLNSNTVCRTSVVRRLTPLECERLQGFPDGWTDIGDWTDSNGKRHKAADSPRYKALGNSIALPYWKVLARRIAAQYDRDITMESLFDGIGGFPLAFQHCGATPVWASEIEEFCIAVTKKRFGDDEK